MRAVLVVPQALGLRIRLDQRDLLVAAAGQAQVLQRFGVDREDAAGGAVFRRHVADGGAVGQCQVLQARAEELHELADHALLAQHLRHGQHQVGGGRAFRQPAGQLEADHLRNQHGGRLAQHRRLGLDAAHAPAQYAQAVDHGGVRVGTEHGIRIGPLLAVHFIGHHHAGQMLQVHLVHDAGARRHHLEVGQRFLAPAQEAVAGLVALELDCDVLFQRIFAAEHVDLHRVVDHQLGRRQRVDQGRVATQRLHRVTHRRQVDHARHAGEVLQQHARRHERDFGIRLLLRIPVGDGLDFLRRHLDAVLVTQQVFQQDLHRERQPLQVEALAQPGQAGKGVLLAVDIEGVAYGKSVFHGRAPG